MEISLESCQLINELLFLFVHKGLCGILARNVVGNITNIPVDPVDISDVLSCWSGAIESVSHDIVIRNTELNKCFQMLKTALVNDCSLFLRYLVEPSIRHALVGKSLVLIHIVRDSVNHLHSRLKLLSADLVLELELWNSHDPLNPLML